jgi:hypothetical protein
MPDTRVEIARAPDPSGIGIIGIEFAPSDAIRPFWVWSIGEHHSHSARVSAAELLSTHPKHRDLVPSWLGSLLLRLAKGDAGIDEIMTAIAAPPR